MAIGDSASSQGFPLVPNTGDQGKVSLGAQEINRTRDFVADIKRVLPTNSLGFRDASGISSGTGDPSGGNDGDIYFKVIV